MTITIPGQLRGPECQAVMTEAIRLRQKLEPIFSEIEHPRIASFTAIFRVGGSLGDFGPPGIQNIEQSESDIECEIVIEPRKWDESTPDKIQAILKRSLLEALNRCFQDTAIDLGSMAEQLRIALQP